MATATVYTISNDTNEIVDKFDCDFNFAIGEYHNKQTPKGRYYIARKDVKVPFTEKRRILKHVKPLGDLNQADKQEQSQ